MKFFGVICAILVFHNALANPVQTRSEECLAGLTEMVDSVPMMIIEALAKTINGLSQFLPEEAQNVIASFENLIMTALPMGPQIIEALTDPCPMSGMKQFKNGTMAMVEALKDVVDAVESVCPKTARELKRELREIMKNSREMLKSIKQAAREAKFKSWIFFWNQHESNALIDILDQETLNAMKETMECCMNMMQKMAEKFISAMDEM